MPTTASASAPRCPPPRCHPRRRRRGRRRDRVSRCLCLFLTAGRPERSRRLARSDGQIKDPERVRADGARALRPRIMRAARSPGPGAAGPARSRRGRRRGAAAAPAARGPALLGAGPEPEAGARCCDAPSPAAAATCPSARRAAAPRLRRSASGGGGAAAAAHSPPPTCPICLDDVDEVAEIAARRPPVCARCLREARARVAAGETRDDQLVARCRSAVGAPEAKVAAGLRTTSGEAAYRNAGLARAPRGRAAARRRGRRAARAVPRARLRAVHRPARARGERRLPSSRPWGRGMKETCEAGSRPSSGAVPALRARVCARCLGAPHGRRRCAAAAREAAAAVAAAAAAATTARRRRAAAREGRTRRPSCTALCERIDGCRS